MLLSCSSAMRLLFINLVINNYIYIFLYATVNKKHSLFFHEELAVRRAVIQVMMTLLLLSFFCLFFFLSFFTRLITMVTAKRSNADTLMESAPSSSPITDMEAVLSNSAKKTRIMFSTAYSQAAMDEQERYKKKKRKVLIIKLYKL